MPALTRIKIVVVGDGGVGKTFLLTRFTKDEIPVGYIPTVFDNTTHSVKHKGVSYELDLWDTAGQETFDRLRALSYSCVDVVLMCFSVDRLTTLENIRDRWLPEVKTHCQDVLLVLVATKIDVRTQSESFPAEDEVPPLTEDQGRQFASEQGIIHYCECSALENINVHQVFETAIEHCPTRTSSCCMLL